MNSGASSSRCSAARRLRGRSRRGRSRANGCGASACSELQTMSKHNHGLAFWSRGFKNWDGPNGRNVQIDYRFGLVGRASNMQVLAKELIDLHPDLIIAVSTSATVPLRQQTTSIPIVFVGVSDPVGLGVVESLAHPGGNITGFTLFEFSIATKWLEVLKETLLI